MKFGFILILLFLSSGVFAVEGVSPGSYSVVFEHGLEKDFVFNFVLNDEGTVSVEGDLKDFVEVDKERISGKESVVARLNLPDFLNDSFEPGVNEVWIVAGDVRGLIKISVAYPDRFVGLELSAPNINEGEDVDVGLSVLNLGILELNVSPVVDIYSGEKVVESFDLEKRKLAVSGKSYFELVLSGENYSAGDYLVVANVDYGDNVAVSENIFRVGEFKVKILNYTRNVGNDIEKFEVEVESLSNERINDVFAEVRFQDEFGKNVGFDSSIVSLEPWEKKTLVGFFDAREFEGEVAMNISVHYGEDVENEKVKTDVLTGFGLVFWIAVSLGIVLLAFLIWWFFCRRK